MRKLRVLSTITAGVLAAAGGATAVPSPATGSPAAAPVAQAAQAADRDRPSRVVMIVLDQLRPEFVDAFDMDNVKALMKGGTNFRRAYLGHMASETVVSHNVMTSGQLPKHMGWADEWYRDVDGVLGAPGQQYVSGSMAREQFNALIEHGGYPKLQDYLEAAHPRRVTAAIGEKPYAVNSMGGPSTDIEVTFSGRDFDCDGDGENSWRGPVGDNSVNVPRYIARPTCGRFYVNSSSARDYGTATTSPAWMYPLDGNRFVPGKNEAHLGGDTWVADAAMKIMKRENWSGLFLTMGGIDKAGHMWGGLNDRPPYPPGARKMTHLPAVARNADEQVGRIISKLRRLGQLEDTLVVLTTDHGQLRAQNYYGQNEPGRSNLNWYYGADADEEYLDNQPALQPLIDTGNVEASMQDSAIRTWLTDNSAARKKEAADVMATLPGVIASYYRTGGHYTLRSRIDPEFLSRSERRWFNRHAQQIVNTEAADYGPDLIGLLHDKSSYGVIGDHGGAQRSVQRIPIVFYGAGAGAGERPSDRIRSVDIMPTVLRAMGIARTYPTDGEAVSLR